MTETVISVTNLSKKYILAHQQSTRYTYYSLRDTISNKTKSILSKIFKPKKQIFSNSAREEFWALKNISFEIKQGDRVGIIGRNGAGKSTLLKILSRITEPTEGKIVMTGRVASLLEVGTGFHPELTGRENIYLNGSILGLSKNEIRRKFDEIVDFAEVEKFLDTPVKHYSSGMYVRLAFAVAAHLEPEILIIDEVLAVGDANFQKKCLGKMQKVSKEEGRTVLFVSHNRDAIQRLCSRCILLKNGQLAQYGDTASVILDYMAGNFYQALPNEWFDLSQVSRIGTGETRFIAVKYSSLNEHIAFYAYTKGLLEFSVEIEAIKAIELKSLAITIYNQSGLRLVNADTILIGQEIHLDKGLNRVQLTIEKLYLNPGVYTVGFWLSRSLGNDWVDGQVLDYIDSAFEIEVLNFQKEIYGRRPKADGIIPCNFNVKIL